MENVDSCFDHTYLERRGRLGVGAMLVAESSGEKGKVHLENQKLIYFCIGLCF